MSEVYTFCTTAGGRLDMPAITALVTCRSGGLIPQARHGAKGVFAFATTGSKFEGTGFEKEHMGHIHVMLFNDVGTADSNVWYNGFPSCDLCADAVKPRSPTL